MQIVVMSQKKSDRLWRLTEEEKSRLCAQKIGDDEPGPILRDFGTLLDFLGPEGIEVRGPNSVLPAGRLEPLNRRLSRPVEVRHRRPRQSSYPNIDGLVLLARAGGLAVPAARDSDRRLVLEKRMLAQWNALNRVERYVFLLESWGFRGRPEIVGGRSAGFASRFTDALQFVRNVLGREEMIVSGDRDRELRLPYLPDLRNLALLDLWGFVHVTHGPAEEGKGWRVATVRRTLWGEVATKLLFGGLLDPGTRLLFAHEEEPERTFGLLIPVFQPYFPDLRTAPAPLQTPFRDGDYIIRVSLGRAKCTLAIPGSWSFHDLAEEILSAFDFDYDHLYAFRLKDSYGRIVELVHPEMEQMDEGRPSDEARIGDFQLDRGTPFEFIYDFGDWWVFRLLIVRVEEPRRSRAELLETRGEAPEQYTGGD
jgi:hypothetical protein